MNSNRDFVEPPKHGFFRRYGWYIIPIGILLWGYGPQIKGFLLDGLNKLIIMNTPAHPEDDDSFVPDDSVFEGDTYGEPQKNAVRRGDVQEDSDFSESDEGFAEVGESDEEWDETVSDEPSTPAEKKELSTLEILERLNHKRIIEQGQKAGVSTEGSDIEILERINHKRIVEQGQKAGVSTEGSDIEILERINHKRIVEQAKRAGVSTEGTDIEILERINRKNLEK